MLKSLINKKAMEAPSTLIVMIIFLVGLAIVILLILFFSGNASDSNSTLSHVTKWGEDFKWS